MIAKIMKGSDFKGVVYYILNDGKGTQIIDSGGLFLENNDTIAQGFIGQARMNPRVTKAVGHIALSYSKIDAALERNSHVERQAQVRPQAYREETSPTSSSGGDLISGSLSLFTPTNAPEEQQPYDPYLRNRKKKKQRKINW